MNTTSVLQQFRQSVYQILPKRADAMVDLVDALTVAGHVDSPVALSEEAPYRRKFSSIYDTLGEGRIVNSRGMRATRSRAYGARESVENTWFLQLLEIDLGSPETAIRVPVSAQFERCFMVI